MAERPLNEQHEWGGQIFRSASTISTGGQTFLASQHAADTVPPQVPFTASYSDDLFAPATGGPSFPQPYVLPSLSDTLHHPHHNAQQTPTVIQQFPPPIPHLPHIPCIPPSYNRPSFSHSSPTPYQRVRNPLPDVNQLPHHTAYHHLPYVPLPSQPHLHHGLPHPYQLPIQYVYIPTPQDISPLPSLPKSLPIISTIHSLNNKSDFYAWDEGVCTLLRLLGIHGHIVDPTLPVNPLRPDQSPALPPFVSQLPTHDEIRAYNRWQDNDNVAQYVIIGRLGGLARQLLPSASMGTRTAYTMYTTITKYFGLQNFGDCDELASSLLQSRCDPNHIQDSIARWRAGVAHLCAAKYPFSIRVFINAFVRLQLLLPLFELPFQTDLHLGMIPILVHLSLSLMRLWIWKSRSGI